MSLETLITALTASIDNLNATILATTKLAPNGDAAGETGTAEKAKPAAKKEETKPATAKKETAKKVEVTQEMMIAALNKLKEEHPKGVEACKPIITKVGKADKMKEIAEENYEAVYKAAQAELKKLEEGGDDATGDDDGM